ncbi:hypothetical protein GCM10023157_04340 [Gluconacetobacter asukensis]
MSWAKKPRKWIAGERIATVGELVDALAESREWFLLNGRLWHAAALRNRSLSDLMNCVRYGRLQRTMLNPRWVDHEETRRILDLQVPA